VRPAQSRQRNPDWENEVAMAALDDVQEARPTFTVRMLKYGTYEVVTTPDEESPSRHISDFRSKDEAQAWIRESGPNWVKRHVRRR
jgi:hypothetical protein